MSNDSSPSADLGLLVLRLTLGGVMIHAGVQKFLAPEGLEGFTKFIETLGLPGPANVLAWAAVGSEIVGGALVVLGLFPRLGALAILGVMVVAAWKVHGPNGFSIVNDASPEEIAKWAPAGPDRKSIPHGMEINVLLGSMALAILLAGGGRISVLGRRKSQAPDA